MTEFLHRLLEDGVRFDPHYPPVSNSDHLPMTLCAMVGLGASEEQLTMLRDDYARILVAIDPAPPIERWEAGIGQSTAYAALLAFFQHEVESRDIGPVVAEVLPRCLTALPADAFHPVIRLGFALSFESKAETAAALAYLVSTTVDLPVSMEPVDIRERMAGQVAAPVTVKGGRFFEGIVALLEAGEYPTGCASGFDECASLALDVYRGTRNFFALHMVTATQAARVCAPVVDEAAMLAPLTGALLAAHRVLGSPGYNAPLPIPDKLDREHSFKYVYACLDEYRAHGDDRYLEEIVGFRDKGLVPAWAAAGVI